MFKKVEEALDDFYKEINNKLDETFNELVSRLEARTDFFSFVLALVFIALIMGYVIGLVQSSNRHYGEIPTSRECLEIIKSNSVKGEIVYVR